MSSIYQPLTQHLKTLPSGVWNTSFAEIERVLSRSLPRSAYEHRPWWANQRNGNHSQSKAWQDAGWITRDVDLAHRNVTFERVRTDTDGDSAKASPPAKPVSGDGLEVLLRRASEMTGIEDRDLLMRKALTALIQREAGLQLAKMGGTMPDAEAAPRERPWG
jgi:hypothetical protein